MPKYHVIPQSGEVVTCRGRKHCSILPIEDHATDEAVAIKRHEVAMAKFLVEAAHVSARITTDSRVTTQVPALDVRKTEDGVTYIPNYHEYRSAAQEYDAEETALKYFPRPTFSLSAVFSKKRRAQNALMENFWNRADSDGPYPFTRAVEWLREMDYPLEDYRYNTMSDWETVFSIFLMPWVLFTKRQVTVKAGTPEQFAALRAAQGVLPHATFHRVGCKC